MGEVIIFIGGVLVGVLLTTLVVVVSVAFKDRCDDCCDGEL